jgi:stage III sporulation protein AC
MDIELIIKIAGIGILVTICSQVLSRAGRDDQAGYVALGGVIVVLLMLVSSFADLISLVREVFNI